MVLFYDDQKLFNIVTEDCLSSIESWRKSFQERLNDEIFGRLKGYEQEDDLM